MKYFAIALLLVPSLLMALELRQTTEECDSVPSRYVKFGCPCLLSNATAGPLESTVVSGFVDSTGNCTGDMYIHLDLASDPIPDYAAILAGTDAVATASQTRSATTSFTDLPGFAASAEYRACFALNGVGGDYPNRVTQMILCAPTFFTPDDPGGGGGVGQDLTGQGLFLANQDGGNTDETPTGNSGTQTSGCTSMANSCSLFSHLGTPAFGQNVYLAEGSVFEDTRVVISHSGGDADNPVEVACYFDEGDDDGNPVQCTSF